ncbi:MAG: 4'-phosphopantetheinyl transferase superfamily protein [Actinomycetota bacterium]
MPADELPPLAEILPPQAVAQETFGDVPGAVLFPQEEAYLARAVDQRRQEFTAGRACARAALAQLGLPPVPIVPGGRGAPQWPDGVVGSITHCAGYRAAVAAAAGDVAALGLDAEPEEPLPSGLLDVIARPAERARLAALAQSAPGVCWDRLLFSAKEAVYKAWYPLTGRRLDFGQADVTIAAQAGTFTARLLVPAAAPDGSALTSFTGRWLAGGGLIRTAVALLAG